MDHLNRDGTFACLYINVEAAQGAREDVRQGMNTLLRELASRTKSHLKDPFPKSILSDILEGEGCGSALNQCLTRWTAVLKKPLVLLVDEIDALVGDTLISTLRQIRSGYDRRPAEFSQSIVLWGVRDVRDYRIHSDREKTVIAGGSAFNVKAESLRLGNLDREEVTRLYVQHTEETGQSFSPGALELAWGYTRGQPWLVNALGYEACFKMKEGRDRTRPIAAEMIAQAKGNLIQRRETHLDQLADKLREERVQRVVSPILQGLDAPMDLLEDDILYVRDLGLIDTEGSLAIANPIYAEIIPPGVSPANRQLRRPDRTRVRPWPKTHRSDDPLALGQRRSESRH